MEMFFMFLVISLISHIFLLLINQSSILANIKNILILKVFMNRNKIFDMILNKFSFLKTDWLTLHLQLL